MSEAKPYCISKREVWEAYKRVKANRGAAGVDGQSITDFEKRLKDNLYRIWNRMSSGSYFPPPVRTVKIPKANGGERKLGIPTVSDRIAQMVVKSRLEPVVDPLFHPDSYGYRPGKSALDAVGQARQRCWRYDWVIDLDIKGFLDPASHYTPFHESPSKRSGCVPITLMHKPFEFLGHGRTGDGSRSFTQCDTVSRARPGIPNASSMGISPSNIPPETPELSSLAMSDAPRCARVVTLTSKEAINYHWRVPARCGISKAFEAAADFAAMGEIDCCNAIPASPVSSSPIVVIADKSRITVWRHHHTA